MTPSTPSIQSMLQLTAVLLLIVCFNSGCATVGKDAAAAARLADVPPRAMAIVGAEKGAASWDALLADARAADIIVLGEQHDDELTHRFQAAFTHELVGGAPVAICMEMFERDEQPFVDAYLADRISQKTLIDVTDARDWGGPAWEKFYQPLVDTAKASKSPLIAANAPRRFTRLGRLVNFEMLAGFVDAYPGQFVTPAPIEESAYAERFKATMSHHGAPSGGKGAKGGAMAGHEMTAAQIDGMFRAQQVWDATMADSVVSAWRAHGKAVLVVGQFHTDHDGGLLLRMKAAAPEAKILTISVDKAESTTLREEDKGRADFVVYRPVQSN